MTPARRAHRFAQVKAWADCRRQYLLRIGDRVIPYASLTDEVFQDLRDRIASDWWWERRESRRQRARRACFDTHILGVAA